MSINVVTLVGRVGTDPDMKYFDSGKVVCKLTLAVNRRSRNDKPDWFTLEIWDKPAEAAGNYVRKGRLKGIKGSLKFDTWSDRQSGTLRSTPVIRVEQWEFLDSKRDSEGNGDFAAENF